MYANCFVCQETGHTLRIAAAVVVAAVVVNYLMAASHSAAVADTKKMPARALATPASTAT